MQYITAPGFLRHPASAAVRFRYSQKLAVCWTLGWDTQFYHVGAWQRGSGFVWVKRTQAEGPIDKIHLLLYNKEDYVL